MDITERIVEPMRLAVLRAKGGPDTLRAAWQELHGTLQATGLFRKGPYFYGVFSMNEARAFDWLAASMQLDEGQSVSAPLEELRFDGGKYATWIYQGAYDGMGKAWSDFMDGVAQHKLEVDPARPYFEHYLDDPGATAAAELRTELNVPVQTPKSEAPVPASP